MIAGLALMSLKACDEPIWLGWVCEQKPFVKLHRRINDWSI